MNTAIKVDSVIVHARANAYFVLQPDHVICLLYTSTMEQSSSASIQIPLGGLTQVCAPHPVDFINSSTNVSPNTVFTWDFGCLLYTSRCV